MDEPSEIPPLPASLVWLKRLVMGLTVVMIVGMALLVGTLLVKMNAAPPPLCLPAEYALPEGAKASGFTVTGDWVIVVSGENTLLVYERGSGKLRQQIALD